MPLFVNRTCQGYVGGSEHQFNRKQLFLEGVVGVKLRTQTSHWNTIWNLDGMLALETYPSEDPQKTGMLENMQLWQRVRRTSFSPQSRTLEEFARVCHSWSLYSQPEETNTSFLPEKPALTVSSSAELWSFSGRPGDLPITQFLKKEANILLRTANITMVTPKNKDFPSLVRAHLQEQELLVKSNSPSLLVSPKDIFCGSWTQAQHFRLKKFLESMHLKSVQIGPTFISEKADPSTNGKVKIYNSLGVDNKAFILMKKKGSLSDFPWTSVIHVNSRSLQ
ncbi:uncharacterized protein LOC142060388 [Phalacrocorax aristotelis]|uniref:uncharacterized protein LOC142060388 n=1 Tax=Phalacrocorax aristotelis TaxID=126867 RepID=UPI003F4BCE5E